MVFNVHRHYKAYGGGGGGGRMEVGDFNQSIQSV